MTTQGGIGFGTKIYIGDNASPVVYTAIGEPFDIGEIGQESTAVDFTNHDSATRAKEYLKGLRDGTTISVSCNRVDNEAGQDAVIAAEIDDDPYDFRVEVPVRVSGLTENAYFKALVMKTGIQPQLEDKIIFMFDLKITGPVQWS